MVRTLHEGLEAMVEEHAVWLVPEYGIGQRGLKIGAMNLMKIRTKSFDIVGSVCPGFYDHTGLEIAYQVRLGWSRFLLHPMANAKKIERMHRIGCDRHAGTNLSEFPSLLEHRNTETEML